MYLTNELDVTQGKFLSGVLLVLYSVCMYLPQAGWYIRSIFKQTTATVNSEFFLTGCRTNAKEVIVLRGGWIHAFPVGISTKWKKNLIFKRNKIKQKQKQKNKDRSIPYKVFISLAYFRFPQWKKKKKKKRNGGDIVGGKSSRILTYR